MGRLLRRTSIGTRQSFEKIMGNLNLHEINASGVYWSDDGSLYIVSDSEWVDYMTGKSSKIPDAECTLDDANFECSDESLHELIFGGGINE